MCSYKSVSASFEVWGFQTRVEDYIHRCIRDVLLLGHRQAFAWIDEWLDMSIEDVRQYELKSQAETNAKVLLQDEKAAGDSETGVDVAADAVEAIANDKVEPSAEALISTDTTVDIA